jgi:hypothetical protein
VLSPESRAVPAIEARWLRLARSWVSLNFSNSSAQRIELSSRAFSRLGLSVRSANVEDVEGAAALFTKRIFWLAGHDSLGKKEKTLSYGRGTVWR